MNNVIIKQTKKINQDDPFFYDGLIANCGKYCLMATGMVEIWCSEHEELCYDCKPRNCCCLPEPEKDEDIYFDEENFYFNHNNWFEIIGIDQKDDPCIDVIFSYDEAIDTLHKLANDIEL